MDPVVVAAAASEWTPLSITTLVVAGIGAVTGGIALIQTHLHHPRPRLVFKWDNEAVWAIDDDFPKQRLEIRNEGSEAARGVRIAASTVEVHGRKPWAARESIESGETWSLLVPIFPVLSATWEWDDAVYKRKPGTSDTLVRAVVKVKHANKRLSWSTKAPPPSQVSHESDEY